MTNTLAIILAGTILTGLILDQLLNTGTATMFLLRKLFDFIEYLAFWR